MARTEELHRTIPSHVAKRIADAVASGDYDSFDEVALTALVEWSARRSSGWRDFETLKSDIALGLEDIEAGRVVPFDLGRIIAQGRRPSARASSSE